MEKHDERKFRDWCHAQGYLCLKLQIEGNRGFPDRTVITPQKVIFMEFKTQVGRLSPHQLAWKGALEKFPTHPYYVPRSFEDAKRYVEEQLSNDTTKNS